MYHCQGMLASVLTVERTNLVTLSMHEATRGKGNKETGNNHALPVYRMLWNYPEDCREFYSPLMDMKAGSVPERGESRFRP